MGQWIGEAFGLLTIIAVGLAIYGSRRDPDALGLSLMLLIAWALTNVADGLWLAPDSKAFNAVTDLTIGLMAVGAYVHQPARWKFTLAAMFGVQLIADTIYQGWILAWPDQVHLSTLQYIWLLNSTFALQLACVGWPGARDVVRNLSDLRNRPLGRHISGGSAWP